MVAGHLKEKIAVPIVNEESSEDINQILFADYMLNWLETVKPSIELITYISYANAVKKRIAPYFHEKGITLHANIHSALQQAYITERIITDPADKIIRPKKEPFVGSSYSALEVNPLLEGAKDRTKNKSSRRTLPLVDAFFSKHYEWSNQNIKKAH